MIGEIVPKDNSGYRLQTSRDKADIEDWYP